MSFITLFTAGLAAFAPLASAYTTPVGDPTGNAIYEPGLNSIVPVGKPFTITWEPTTDGNISLVLLHGPSTNVVPIQTIAESIENSGSYDWTPSTDLAPNKTYYGLELIVVKTGQYQYSTQFGISNDDYDSSSSSSASSSVSTSTTVSVDIKTPIESKASSSSVASGVTGVATGAATVTGASSTHAAATSSANDSSSSVGHHTTSLYHPANGTTLIQATGSASSNLSSSTLSTSTKTATKSSSSSTGSGSASGSASSTSSTASSTGGAAQFGASFGALAFAAGIAALAM